jgi:chemotaxis protein methyltransferase CheR
MMRIKTDSAALVGVDRNAGTASEAGTKYVSPKPIDKKHLAMIGELIHDRLGIYISRDKEYLLEHKIGRLLSHGNYSCIDEFYTELLHNTNEAMEELIRYITTTHTFFFRENRHLNILRKDIILRRITRPLIWVAACATGEEVYSIIIELLEHGITDFFIVASDINRDVLFTCKRGVYPRERMKELPEAIIRKYFIPVRDRPQYFRVKDMLRGFFIVKKLNLIDHFLFEEQFDYIFCRNVLIYFNLETQRRALDVLMQNLKRLGYLFVGHAESLIHVTGRLESVFASVYNKKP